MIGPKRLAQQRVYNKRYRDANPDKYLESQRAVMRRYRKRHPEIILAQQERRRAKPGFKEHKAELDRQRYQNKKLAVFAEIKALVNV